MRLRPASPSREFGPLRAKGHGVQVLRATLLLLILTACVDDPVGIGVLGIAVDGAGTDTVWVGAPGELVASGVRLHITDGEGRPLPGASLEWEAIGRNAQLTAAAPKSNAAAVATAAWQLGTDAGPQPQRPATRKSHWTVRPNASLRS